MFEFWLNGSQDEAYTSPSYIYRQFIEYDKLGVTGSDVISVKIAIFAWKSSFSRISVICVKIAPFLEIFLFCSMFFGIHLTLVTYLIF